jgi:hypothetical protein
MRKLGRNIPVGLPASRQKRVSRGRSRFCNAPASDKGVRAPTRPCVGAPAADVAHLVGRWPHAVGCSRPSCTYPEPSPGRRTTTPLGRRHPAPACRASNSSPPGSGPPSEPPAPGKPTFCFFWRAKGWGRDVAVSRVGSLLRSRTGTARHDDLQRGDAKRAMQLQHKSSISFLCGSGEG